VKATAANHSSLAVIYFLRMPEGKKNTDLERGKVKKVLWRLNKMGRSG